LEENSQTLVIDEAHLSFSHETLVFELIKQRGGNKPKLLLFSAAATGISKHGQSIVTKSEIRNKYRWYPPISDRNALSEELRKADVYLSK